MTGKTAFFEWSSSFKFNNLRLALGIHLKFYTSVEKASKLKTTKFWSLILTFAEVIEEKLVGWRDFWPLPSWIGLKTQKQKQDKIVWSEKSKLNSIEVLISKVLIELKTSYDDFVFTNNMLNEYDKMKDEIKKLKT